LQVNKRVAGILAVGVLVGAAGAISLQVRAQQTTNQTPQAQSITKAAATTDKTAVKDTDNIQDSTSVDQPDAADSTVKETDTDLVENNNQGQAADNQTGDQNDGPADSGTEQ
jgi:hypothetical protein